MPALLLVAAIDDDRIEGRNIHIHRGTRRTVPAPDAVMACIMNRRFRARPSPDPPNSRGMQSRATAVGVAR